MDLQNIMLNVLSTPEVQYILLLFALFVFPKWLQRFRIPGAITSLLLGMVASMFLHLFDQDATIQLLATFGIVSMFLFAGLEMDFVLLRKHFSVLIQHIAIQLVTLLLIAWIASFVFDLSSRAAIVLAMALLTPSAGFILDSLLTLKVSNLEKEWIKSKVLATELVTLSVLFFVLQSTSAVKMSVSLGVLIALVVILPILFKLFASWIIPFAPKSEFAFLLMVAVVSSLVTRRLGVYYLVGAFIVGITAQNFQKHLPAIASEKMLHAVEVFASFFIPFYFFNAGMHLHKEDFNWYVLLAGISFAFVLIPTRIFQVALHRRFALHETLISSRRIGIALLPSLVFTIVLAEILRERFEAPPIIFGGLIVYTIVTTVLPSILLRSEPPQGLSHKV